MICVGAIKALERHIMGGVRKRVYANPIGNGAKSMVATKANLRRNIPRRPGLKFWWLLVSAPRKSMRLPC